MLINAYPISQLYVILSSRPKFEVGNSVYDPYGMSFATQTIGEHTGMFPIHTPGVAEASHDSVVDPDSSLYP